MASRAVLFQTERLCVRQIDDRDFDDMMRIYGDLEAMEFVGDGTALTKADCLAWIETTRNNYDSQGYGLSCFVHKPTGHTIGFGGFTHPGQQVDPELKYSFERSSWGQGFATEAALGMVAYGESDLGFDRIIATVDGLHIASHRVLAKAGFTFESTATNEDRSETETWVRQVSKPPRIKL